MKKTNILIAVAATLSTFGCGQVLPVPNDDGSQNDTNVIPDNHQDSDGGTDTHTTEEDSSTNVEEDSGANPVEEDSAVTDVVDATPCNDLQGVDLRAAGLQNINDLEMRDLDGDGKDDLIVASNVGVSVFYGHSCALRHTNAGMNNERVLTTGNVLDVQLTDLNNDRSQDFVFLKNGVVETWNGPEPLMQRTFPAVNADYVAVAVLGGTTPAFFGKMLAFSSLRKHNLFSQQVVFTSLTFGMESDKYKFVFLSPTNLIDAVKVNGFWRISASVCNELQTAFATSPVMIASNIQAFYVRDTTLYTIEIGVMYTRTWSEQGFDPRVSIGGVPRTNIEHFAMGDFDGDGDVEPIYY